MGSSPLKDINADIQYYRKAILQSGLLFSTQLLMVLIGFGIKSIQTNHFGPEDYGLYAFFGSITGFSAIFFRFGYFSSLQVLMARNEDQDRERDYFGAGLKIAITIGIIYSLFLFGLGFFLDDWFDLDSAKGLGTLLQYLSPLCMAIPMRYYILSCSFGSNKVRWAAIYDLIPKVLFFLALLALVFYESFGLKYVLLFNVLTVFITFVAVVLRLKPSFNNSQSISTEIKEMQKEHGLAFYWGTLAAYSTYRVDELFISKLVNTTSLGFYTLAGVLCAPMTMLSASIAQSSFKRFSGMQKIPAKLFRYNTLWLLSYVLFIGLTGKYWVSWIFGSAFDPVIPFILPLSIAYFFQGMYQPYMFLTAKAQGRQIRNIAYLEAVVNVVGNIILIPIYGVMGAIYTSIGAKAIHFLGKHLIYLKYLKSSLKK